MLLRVRRQKQSGNEACRVFRHLCFEGWLFQPMRPKPIKPTQCNFSLWRSLAIILCYIYNTILWQGSATVKNCIGLALLASVAWAGTASPQSTSAEKRDRPRSQIVFVCEHGAALSVVSAAYFNKLARE